jgi:nucleotide-binding universal stress UspA family protein
MTEPAVSETYRVVAALDFSPLGERAVVEAVRACTGHAHAELHVAIVAFDHDGLLRLPGEHLELLTPAEADRAARDHVAQILDQHDALVHATGLSTIAVYVAPGGASERIVSLAAAVDADLIVLGTHGRTGISRLVLGSVAEQVVRTAGCGVLVIRPRDFLNGEKLPDLALPLKPGEHSLRPFSHGPSFHYVRRSASSRMMVAE